MIPTEFKYNSEATYQPGVFKVKTVDIINQNIIVSSDGKSFNVSFPNILEKYILPHVSSEEVVTKWRANWMSFWQNQLNFAIWLSTSGCGVDYDHHLKDTGMIGSLFRFHVYYQIRRILKEMSSALPQDPSWNAFDNNYNRSAYERICKEFNVDVNTDWRQKKDDNQGLGRIYQYKKGWKQYEWKKNPWIGDYEAFDWGVEFGASRPDGETFSFTKPTGGGNIKIDFIAQGAPSTNVWSTFIIDDAKGFTRAGVERINESIRTYCWAILGAQSQTRTDILGTGTAFDAQKQFLANVEDAINSPVDLPSQIARYQNTLKYARSKVDFVYGIGLYMSPSNMELRIGTIQDYNNEIVIATVAQDLGLNNGVNTKPVPPKQTHNVQGTSTKKTLTKSNLLQTDYRQKVIDYAKKHNLPQSWIDGCSAEPGGLDRWIAAHKKYEESLHSNERSNDKPANISEHHENNKSALIFGSIVIGVAALILYKIT